MIKGAIAIFFSVKLANDYGGNYSSKTSISRFVIRYLLYLA